MSIFKSPRSRDLLVTFIWVVFLVVASTMSSNPAAYGLSREMGMWGTLTAAIMAPVTMSLGARWVRAARPMAADPDALIARRARAAIRVSRTMAVLLCIAFAIGVPLYVPEAQTMSWPLASLAGVVLGAVVGWILGHVMVYDVWALRMPRLKK